MQLIPLRIRCKIGRCISTKIQDLVGIGLGILIMFRLVKNEICGEPSTECSSRQSQCKTPMDRGKGLETLPKVLML